MTSRRSDVLWEIFGAVLLWAVGTIAIAEWFAIQRLSARLDKAEDERDALLSDTAHMLKQYSEE